MTDKYTLDAVSTDETALFYSSHEPGHDKEIGCIGHLRQDFGRDGKGFWTTWENHCTELKTQAFKDEFDDVINALRGNVLKDRAALSAYCREHSQAKLDDGRGYNYGFKLKTDSHVFYLRLCPLENDYNLYCYAYNREMLEKHFASLGDTVMTDELRSKLEATAAFIIEKSANATTSGNYIIGADDIPGDILSPELFEEHITDIAAIMGEYEAVADVGFTTNGEIDVIIYSDYCPNYEPLPEEAEDFPDNRKILDPLAPKRVPQKEDTPPKQPTPKPSLLETLERNKQKAARQAPSSTHKPSGLEV